MDTTKTPRVSRSNETPAMEFQRRMLGLLAEREDSEHARERRYQSDRDLVLALWTRFIQDSRQQGWSAHLTPSETERLALSQMVCVHTPIGQMAWGLSPERTRWFAHLKLSRCKWDKHNAGDRTARGRKLLTLDTLFPKTERTTSRRRARRKRA